MSILAQVGRVWAGWGLVEFIIALIIVAGIVAVAYIAMKQMGWTPPPWAVQIFWILVVCVVAIVAIRFLMSL